MFSPREAQTKLLILAVVILSLSFLIVAIWGGMSLVSSSTPPTQVFVVTISQTVNPTVVLTPITTGTPNATDIAVAATQQARFESEHIRYPTLPASNIPETGSSAVSRNLGVWLGILSIIAVFLAITVLALRARLQNAKR